MVVVSVPLVGEESPEEELELRLVVEDIIVYDTLAAGVKGEVESLLKV